MAEQLSSFEGIELTASDETIITNVVPVSGDPSTGGGLVAPVGSLALSTTGRAYFKHNTGNTDWVTVFTQLPGELALLFTPKLPVVGTDRLLIEDSEDSFNKKYITVQEIINTVSSATAQGLDFSRRGNLTATTTLLTRDGILSSNSGHPVGVTSPALSSVNVSTRFPASYTLRLFQHEGDSVNRLDLADVVAVNTANLRAQAGVDFVITNPISADIQLGVEIIAGGARDIMVEVVLSGTL